MTQSTGPVSAEVTLEDGRTVRRHQDQMSFSKVKDSNNSAPKANEKPVKELATETQTRYPTRERRRPKKLEYYEL